MIITVNRYIKTFNTRIYNLSSGPHITCFFVVIAKKKGHTADDNSKVISQAP